MKFADINKKFSEVVADYMAKGYTINTATMSGSQGEVAKVDFTDGKVIIRVLLKSFSDWRNDTEGYEIIVGKNTDKVKIHDADRLGNTIWNEHLEVIATIRFYQIGRYGTDCFGTEEEAKAATEIRQARWIAKRTSSKSEDITDKAMAIAKKYIRRQIGIKRVYDSKVKVARKDGQYVITYCDKSYRLR